jgi:proteasome-associated ATPase
VHFPALAAKYSLKSRSGILLWGLPGNGKTRIGRCCAGYVRKLFPDRPCRFMHVSGSCDYNLWFGETERRVRERFRAAREAAEDGLVIMMWDEIDAIARRRGTDHGSSAPDRILNTLLSEIDGVLPLSNILLLYTSNRPETVDPGLLRPGRTDVKIEIPTPNRRGAEAILRGYLIGRVPLAAAHRGTDELIGPLLSRLFAPNGEYAVVAHVKLSDGRRMPVAGRELVSGAMLENVVFVAAQSAAAREADGGAEGVLEEDLTVALEIEMGGAVSLLTPATVKNYVKSIPQDSQPIAIESHLRPR